MLYVRVESELYPGSYGPPMSTTTTSPVFQLAVGALVVRVGAVGPGPDDDERHLRMSFGENRLRDVGGHVGLGAARHQELGHAGVHAIDCRSGLAQRVDLRSVLDHSQAAQHVGGEHRNHAEHVGQREQVQRGHRIRDRRRRRGAPEGVGDELVRVLAVDPVAHGQAQFGHRRLP